MAKELVTIIDYGSGNLRSAAKACEHAAAELGLAVEVCVSAEAEMIARADRLVLPGQGAFGDCMAGLAASGLLGALEDAVLVRKIPFLGICVGMQLLADTGQEHGSHKGLGWIGGSVEAIAPLDARLKIPHMGWNDLTLARAHPVMDGIETGADFYFVHSYHFILDDEAALIAQVDYGHKVAAVVGRDNIIGTQFHPEKSADAGLRLMGNFLRWEGL